MTGFLCQRNESKCRFGQKLRKLENSCHLMNLLSDPLKSIMPRIFSDFWSFGPTWSFWSICWNQNPLLTFWPLFITEFGHINFLGWLGTNIKDIGSNEVRRGQKFTLTVNNPNHVSKKSTHVKTDTSYTRYFLTYPKYVLKYPPSYES